MQIEDITLLKELGSGTFGKVYLSTKKGIPKNFATKQIKINLIKNKRVFDCLMNEVKIMKILNHPNIVKFEDMKKINGNYYITMEYINGKDLSKCLTMYMKKNSKPFSEEIVQYLMK